MAVGVTSLVPVFFMQRERFEEYLGNWLKRDGKMFLGKLGSNKKVGEGAVQLEVVTKKCPELF